MTKDISKLSNPSDLKITDMRITVVGDGGCRWPIFII